MGPDGKAIVDGAQALKDSAVTLEVKEATKGVYRLHTKGQNVWFESSLPQAVVWTGDQGANLHNFNDPITDEKTGKPRDRAYYEKHGALVFHANRAAALVVLGALGRHNVHRRAMRDQWSMSQREDWGFFIISPRGQRVRALWGQPAPSHAGGRIPAASARRGRSRTGSRGAGSGVWRSSLGDSHHLFEHQHRLDGVPPYLARSPEEWFDPRTGAAPDVPLYDETPFLQHTPIGDASSFQQLHHRAKQP